MEGSVGRNRGQTTFFFVRNDTKSSGFVSPKEKCGLSPVSVRGGLLHAPRGACNNPPLTETGDRPHFSLGETKPDDLVSFRTKKNVVCPRFLPTEPSMAFYRHHVFFCLNRREAPE